MLLFEVIIVLNLLLGQFGVRSDENQCFIPGECEQSTFLRESITLGENSCLHFCQKVEGCKWFTYHPENSLCVAMSNCIKLNSTGNAISGQVECKELDNRCWVRGICQGIIITEVTTRSSEECQDLCLSNPECGWFSFDHYPSACFLFKDCPTLDETCSFCVSSSSKCRAKTSYTKLFVGMGLSENGFIDEIEIIDLESPASMCPNLPKYPIQIVGSVGGLYFQEQPYICGGFVNEEVNDCNYFENGEWKTAPPLSTARFLPAILASPYPKEMFKLFVTGGSNGSTEYFQTTELLGESGWQEKLPNLPVPLNAHCMVLLNDTTVMVIGGGLNTSYSSSTFLLNTDHQVWTEGPALNYKRSVHGCGRIRKNYNSSKFLIIAVAGFNGTDMSSVEIFDEETMQWRMGPELPFGIADTTLVEDPAGGVILVGGISRPTSLGYLDTLLRLPHAEADQWEEMPQHLKTKRRYLTAFMIPDGITDCSFH